MSKNPTTTLRDEHCQPLPEGTPALPAEEARALIAQLDPAWRIADDGRSLRRAYRFDDFYRTMAFLNAVAYVANAEDHHPDFEAGYNYCRLQFSTHTVGGLSRNDFICAAKLDAM
jgi:4a-hydroxytetrahydrobiopterin dehydratase